MSVQTVFKLNFKSFEIILDSYAVLRNNIEISRVVLLSFLNGGILQTIIQYHSQD
jgi:hypothetical protein